MKRHFVCLVLSHKLEDTAIMTFSVGVVCRSSQNVESDATTMAARWTNVLHRLVNTVFCYVMLFMTLSDYSPFSICVNNLFKLPITTMQSHLCKHGNTASCSRLHKSENFEISLRPHGRKNTPNGSLIPCTEYPRQVSYFFLPLMTRAPIPFLFFKCGTVAFTECSAWWAKRNLYIFINTYTSHFRLWLSSYASWRNPYGMVP